MQRATLFISLPLVFSSRWKGRAKLKRVSSLPLARSTMCSSVHRHHLSGSNRVCQANIHPSILWWWYSDWRLSWLTPHRVAVCWDGEWFRTSAPNKTWVLRFHFLRTVHPHPLTLSPYVQMLARGITGALGWIRRPLRGRESRGGHGRGWPATQLPAQVSTGWHEQLFQPPPAHSLHSEGGPPQLKSSSERICGQNGSC